MLNTNMRPGRLLSLLMIGAILGSLGSILPASPAVVQAPGTTRTFPETGKTVKGKFLAYWTANGGLAQQGFPISEEMSEKSDTDGKTYTVQYFERAVFELHPENAGKPSEVLLSLLGRFEHTRKYAAGSTQPVVVSGAGDITPVV